MSYPIVNKKPPFLPYDIVKVKCTNTMAIIREVNLNTCQNKDEHQWSFSVYNLSKKNDKVAWYDKEELQYIDNIFEIMAHLSSGGDSTSDFPQKFLKELRREV